MSSAINLDLSSGDLNLNFSAATGLNVSGFEFFHLFGSELADRFIGSSGADYFGTQNGNDTASGGGGVDTFDGSGGNDVLIGGTGGDFLYGGPGNDVLIGDHVAVILGSGSSETVTATLA
ncbi:MAG: hypothetical protein HC777_01770 [Hyphomonadaceae bacterium]|nr:hypothetical protein [Hyphomonadaceae bacterium]